MQSAVQLEGNKIKIMSENSVDPVFFVTLHSAIEDPENEFIKKELISIHNRFERLFKEIDKKMGKFIITDKGFGEPLDELEVRFKPMTSAQENPTFQRMSVNISFIFRIIGDLQLDVMGDIQSIFNKTDPGSKISAVLPTITKFWESVQLIRDAAWKLKSDEEIQKVLDSGIRKIDELPFVQELLKLRVFL